MRFQDYLDAYRIKHFKERELLQDKFVPVDKWENSTPTVLIMDHMREALEFPIIISGEGNGAYRSLEDHKKVYEVINRNREELGKEPLEVPMGSLHLEFNAFDIAPKSGKDIDLLRMKDYLLSDAYNIRINWNGGVLNINRSITGIGLYRWGIHLDTRGALGRPAPARW